MYRGFSFFPPGTHIPFIRFRAWFFVFSALLVIASIVLFAARGLNYGVDFLGGIVIEVRLPQKPDVAAMRDRLNALGLGAVELQEFGERNEVLIRLQSQEGDERAQMAAAEKVRASLGTGIEVRRVEYVGPKVSEELFWDGIYAATAAIIAIMIYVWFRFEWQFGVCAVIALTHDVISTIGLFALSWMEFNLTTVAAVLTIAGYSINDTVVVFDRVRENLRKYKTMPLPELFDRSINETLSRTTMTSATTLLAVVALYFLGGEVIRGFSAAMMWGIVIGTYSSICVALPLALYLEIPRGGRAEDDAAAPVGGGASAKTP